MATKKLLCLGLILALMMTMAACGGRNPETTSPAQLPEESEAAAKPQEETAEMQAENPVTYFSMTLGESYESYRSLMAYEDQGSAHVEYVGTEKKVGKLDMAFLHDLTECIAAVGADALNGRSEYAEGEATGGMYIAYADGSYLSADFSGVVPEEFIVLYQALDHWFAEQTGDLPVYVPQPLVMGDVDEALLGEILSILEASGMTNPDTLCISQVPMDEYFAFTAGLSDDEGIRMAAQCTAMMMTTPYSFVVVQLEDQSIADGVREDFRNSLNWQKWVCVMPTDALIAQKGDLVLCLMGADDLYDLTAAGIEASGWTRIETHTFPG